MGGFIRFTALLLLLGVLIGWPLGATVAASFASGPDVGLSPSADYNRLGLATNTVLLVVLTLLLSVPAGTAAGVALFRTDMPCRRLLVGVAVVGLLVPADLQATAWLAAVGPQGLLVGYGWPWPLAGLCGAAWIHAMIALPWVVLVVGVASSLVEAELEQAALLSAGLVRTVLGVTLRRAAGGLVAAALVVAVITGGEMAVTDLLRVRTYAEAIYTEFVLAGRVGVAARTALPGLILLACLVVGAGWSLSRVVPANAQAALARRLTFRLGPAGPWVLAGVLLLMAIPMAVPAVSLLWRTGLSYPTGAAVAAGGSGVAVPAWSVARLGANLWRSLRVCGPEMAYSLGLAAAAMALMVPLALWLLWESRLSGHGRLTVAVVAGLLFSVPAPVLGAGVSLAVNGLAGHGPGGGPLWLAVARLAWAVADSPAVLVWVQGLRALPFVLLVLWPALWMVNQSTLQAAVVDGAGFWDQFRHVVVPACGLATAAAAVLGAMVCLGELGATVIVTPPGLQPLSLRIFTLAHTGVESYLTGICLVLILIVSAGSAVAVLCLSVLARRWSAR